MARFVYQPLDANKEEIRTVTLHPGARGNVIRMNLLHVPFKITSTNEESPIAWDELQATLPHRWVLGETLEGKAIFHYNGSDQQMREKDRMQAQETPFTSWDHPNPGVSRDRYETKNSQGHSIPEYEALSYTWGSAQNTNEIEISSGSSDAQSFSTLSIGQNLFQALQDLRKLDRPRTLWIDALSINQEDLDERSSQVTRMQHIYTYATRVVVWLGPEKEDSTLALRTLEYLGQQLEYTKTNYWMPAPNRTEKDWWLPEHRINYSVSQWDAIAHLIQRPWFGRLWIVQEIQLANQEAILQCGDIEVRWYHLRRAFLKFRRIVVGVPQFASSSKAYDIMQHLVYLSLNQTSNSLEDILTTSLRCECTNPRDRIYGLIGLLPQPMAKLIQPDYNLSSREIYTQSLLQTIEVMKRWLPICIESLGDDSIKSDLPSWVPNYSNPETYNQIEAPISFSSGSSAASIVYKAPDELHVSGLSCSRIARITPLIPNDVRAAVKLARDFWIDQGLDSTSNDMLDTYIWTLSMGKLNDRWVRSDFDPSLADAKLILEDLYRGAESRLGDCNDCYKPWVLRSFQRLAARKLFWTQDGRVGVCNAHAKIGDTVMVALGLYFPMLLRLASAGKFRIVGRCYVQGLMDGEAILGAIPTPWKVVVRRSLVLTGVPVLQMRFVNLQTGEDTIVDPRLDALPEHWEEVEKVDEVRLGVPVTHYLDRKSGVVINSDPRLLPEVLKARGLRVEGFCLV